MWKLLNPTDRKLTKENQTGELLRLTTEGIGEYRCHNCQHYGVAADQEACGTMGVLPDAMPCGLDPRHPERHFVPIPTVGIQLQNYLNKQSLSDLLILSNLLPQRIVQQAQTEQLGLPYRVGDLVSFVHAQTLTTSRITALSRDTVQLELEALVLPHSAVIPRPAAL